MYWVRGILSGHESFEPQREHCLLFIQREVLADATREESAQDEHYYYIIALLAVASTERNVREGIAIT